MRVAVRVHGLSKNIIIRKFMGTLDRSEGFDTCVPFCFLRKTSYTAPVYYGNVFTI